MRAEEEEKEKKHMEAMQEELSEIQSLKSSLGGGGPPSKRSSVAIARQISGTMGAFKGTVNGKSGRQGYSGTRVPDVRQASVPSVANAKRRPILGEVAGDGNKHVSVLAKFLQGMKDVRGNLTDLQEVLDSVKHSKIEMLDALDMLAMIRPLLENRDRLPNRETCEDKGIDFEKEVKGFEYACAQIDGYGGW